MATINVEFKALGDPRFKILSALINKDTFSARGRTEAVWAHCIERMQYDLPGPIIDVLSEVPGFAEAMVEADLAEKLSSGRYRIKGTAGRIEYLTEARARQKVATEAARTKKLKQRESKKQQDLALNGDESNVGPDLGPKDGSFVGIQYMESSSTSTSSSSSSSSSVSASASGSASEKNVPPEGGPSQQGLLGLNPVVKTGRPPRTPKPEAVTAKVWEAYKAAFHEAYEHDPPDGAKIRGQMANFVKALGAEDAPHVARFYVLEAEDPFYEANRHDFGHCLSNAHKLRTDWKLGGSLTLEDARKRFREKKQPKEISDGWDDAAKIVRERLGQRG